MSKFVWHNTKKFDDAEYVLLGVPDESGTNSKRSGVSEAPSTIRNISIEREVFERGKEKSQSLPYMCHVKKRIHDYGNKKKKKLENTIWDIVKKNKIPVVVGGDHSITAEVLKGIDKLEKKISVVYFDAHPDFISTSSNQNVSTICNIKNYEYIDFDSSIEIGIRAPEPEELRDIRKSKLKTLTPLDVTEFGIKKVVNEIKRTVDRHVYVSIDMDVIDPAFAPGVSTPVPGGLSSTQLIYLMKEIAELNLVGFDIMEVNPQYDIQDMTSQLAARTIIETISSCGTKKK